MLARAFGLVGKTWKRTRTMSVEASASPRRRSQMPQQQLCHLHGSTPSQRQKFPEEQLPGDTVEGSFDLRFAALKSIGEDRVNDRELKLLLKKKHAPICYVWCDPCPWMHISQGIMKTLNINKMVESGFKVKILMADWFSQMNSEISGNLNKMRTVGRYNIEMWKATGMALDKVDLVWLSDEIRQHGDEYWPIVMDIARTNSCASILFQKADIWLLGMEQHDANLLARQYYKHFKKKNKAIAVLDNMLPNLLQYPQMENRRHPAWAIFMEDDKEDICFKMEKAFCPPKLAEGNPCLEYIKYIILPWFGMFEVVQKKGNGGKKTFLSMEELTADYESGALHPADVKLALEKSLNEILQPVRDHFGRNGEAKDLVEAIGECYGAD
uniref:Tyrosine--tRNA ligase n=1 Tax=Oryza meridionalis TaxID=40149 RepID=A0A0E0EG58_9ORYZ